MTCISSTKQMVAIIKQTRLDKGLTQSELGKMVGMSQKKIATVETMAVSPKMDLVLILLSALGFTLSVQSNTNKKTDNNVKIVWD